MAIVKEYDCGSSKAYIHDDYIKKNQDEVEKIIQNVSVVICSSLMEKTA